MAKLSERLKVMVARNRLGYSERFEQDAERFYAETGFMAPGKSVPLEMASSNSEEEREEAWAKWTDGLREEWYREMESTIAVCAAVEAFQAADKARRGLHKTPYVEWDPAVSAEYESCLARLLEVNLGK
jgi:predicted phosphoadenosine phosphosulfate sulfurtransferase